MADKLDQVLVGRDDPVVCKVRVLIFQKFVLEGRVEHESLAGASLPPGDVLDQEAVGIEPRQENVSDNSAHAFLAELKGLGTHNRRVTQVESASISTEVVSNDGRVGVVLLRFGHLAAVFGKDDTIDYKVFERSNSLDSGGDDHQGVEPATCLVKTFSDEVGGEFLFEIFLRLGEGVVTLGEGHSARFEPAVKDFRDSLEHAFSLLGWNLNVVDELTVKVGDALDSGKFLELLDTTDTDSLFTIVRDPHWDRVSPVSVTREAPVLSIH